MKSTKLTQSMPKLVVAFLSLTIFGVGTAFACHFTDSGCEIELVNGNVVNGYAASAGGAFVQASAQIDLTSTSSSGYGVKSAGESNFSSLDNNGNTELLVFKFGHSLTLDKVTFGYSNIDADFSLFAWTGSTGATNGDVLSSINGKTVSGLATASTWTLIGNYSAPTGANWYNQKEVDVNNGEIAGNGVKSSSWWIISAYNSSYGGNSGSFGNGNDYMKVLGVACLPSGGGGGQVSEPASLLLFGVAMMGVVGLRRRRQDLI